MDLAQEQRVLADLKLKLAQAKQQANEQANKRDEQLSSYQSQVTLIN